MKEKILAKIAEMIRDNSELFDKFVKIQGENRNEYENEMGGDFVAGGYEGDSLSHMLDILTEQEYILGKLYDFVYGLEA